MNEYDGLGNLQIAGPYGRVSGINPMLQYDWSFSRELVLSFRRADLGSLTRGVYFRA